ncbi:hypothetical protein SAMN04488121_10818 [Chitinophaga filiformis]|uniref:Uncharacterized protein n=1 Tax=Chitinophaga filiformis TaxID=104663 RepID=A0A1G7YV14_CHIFI|nr:hypothetical protein SAMN04488121_10818 [Chitinophaga filiformis]
MSEAETSSTGPFFISTRLAATQYTFHAENPN